MSDEWGSSSRGGTKGAESVVVDYVKRKNTCGYCKSGARTRISHGLSANSLTVNDYQDLLDRGWRRSGSFLYKPEMESTCCPSYTIRVRAMDFRPSKEQLRVSRRMQKFLDGKMDVKKTNEPMTEPTTSRDSSICNRPKSAMEPLDCKHEKKTEEDKIIIYLSDKINLAMSAWSKCGTLPLDVHLPKPSVQKVSFAKRKLRGEGCEGLVYTSNVAFQIAAAIQRIISVEKCTQEGINPTTSENTNAASPNFCPKQIADNLAAMLVEVLKDSGLSIRACNGYINIYAANKNVVLDGISLSIPYYEVSSINCKQKKVIPKVVSAESHQKRLEIRLKRSSFDAEEYGLYRKYQIKVHNDTREHVTETAYRRFLVDTPLVPVQPADDGTVPPCGFGSFHQQYVIDGHLVAVGVVDILPKCLSSKYLFWDPDFAFLSLGKYSALQEISWVKENQAYCSSLRYYYLGYYIHSCNKMRYKARYCPSELLCPLRYKWKPFEIAKPQLDKKPYFVLSDITNSENGEAAAPPSGYGDDEEVQHANYVQEDFNDVFVDGGDHKMVEVDSERSDDELARQSNDLTVVGDVLIGVSDARRRFKELYNALGYRKRHYLESQLKSYKKVVGDVIAERMVYFLG